MAYYNNDNLIIRSMVKSDIEKLANGFLIEGFILNYIYLRG